MAKRRKSRSRRKSGSSVGDYFVLVLLISAVAAILGGIFFLYQNREQDFTLNSTDLCPQIGARSTVAILLDTTDEISGTTRQDIQNRARLELEKLPRFSRLAVYKMDDEGLNSKPIVTLCNPGQLSEMGGLAQQGITANPGMIQSKYDNFSTKISAAADQMFRSSFEGRQSPLLSALQELSLILPRPVLIDAARYPAGQNKIIYITDLMEHTDTFSVYQSGVDMNAFRDSRATEKFGKRYEEDLEFWILQRDNRINTSDLIQFWGKVFIQEFDFPKSQNLKMSLLLGES
jgi:hypothetical protein